MNQSLCALSEDLPLNYTARRTKRRYTCRKLKIFWMISLSFLFIASALLWYYWELLTEKNIENDIRKKMQYSLDETYDDYQDIMKELNKMNEMINEEQNKLIEKDKTIQMYRNQINQFNEDTKKMTMQSEYELQHSKALDHDIKNQGK